MARDELTAEGVLEAVKQLALATVTATVKNKADRLVVLAEIAATMRRMENAYVTPSPQAACAALAEALEIEVWSQG